MAKDDNEFWSPENNKITNSTESEQKNNSTLESDSMSKTESFSKQDSHKDNKVNHDQNTSFDSDAQGDSHRNKKSKIKKPISDSKKRLIIAAIMVLGFVVFGFCNHRFSILYNLKNALYSKATEHSVSKYELSEMLANSFTLSDTAGYQLFSDVAPENEYYGSAQGMGCAGLVEADVFEGESEVTKRYVAYSIAKLSNRATILESLGQESEYEPSSDDYVTAAINLGIIDGEELDESVTNTEVEQYIANSQNLYFDNIDKENRADVDYVDDVVEVDTNTVISTVDDYTYEFASTENLQVGQNIIVTSSSGIKSARKITNIDGNTVTTTDANFDEVVDSLDFNYYHEITEEEFLKYLEDNYEEYTLEESKAIFEDVDVSEAGVKEIWDWFTSTDKSDYEYKKKFSDFHVRFMVSASSKSELVGDKDNTVAGYLIDENGDPKTKESGDVYFKVWWGNNEPKIYAPVGSAIKCVKKLRDKGGEESGFTADMFEREFLKGKITIMGDLDLTGMAFYVNAQKNSGGSKLQSAEVGMFANINIYNKIKVSGEMNIPLFLPMTFTAMDIATVTVVPYFHVGADGTIQWAFQYDYHAAVQYSRDGIYKNNIIDNRFNTEFTKKVSYPREDVPGGIIADGEITGGAQIEACLVFFNIQTFKTVASFGIGAEASAAVEYVDDSTLPCTDFAVGYPTLSFAIAFGDDGTKVGSILNVIDQLDGDDEWPATYENSISVKKKEVHVETQEDGTIKAVKNCTRTKIGEIDTDDEITDGEASEKEGVTDKIAGFFLSILEGIITVIAFIIAIILLIILLPIFLRMM